MNIDDREVFHLFKTHDSKYYKEEVCGFSYDGWTLSLFDADNNQLISFKVQDARKAIEYLAALATPDFTKQSEILNEESQC